jgi:hypothetical protein
LLIVPEHDIELSLEDYHILAFEREALEADRRIRPGYKSMALEKAVRAVTIETDVSGPKMSILHREAHLKPAPRLLI